MLWDSSQSIVNGKLYFSTNFFCFLGESADTPIIAYPNLENSLNSSRNPSPSTVQPGVLALGKNHKTIFWFLKLDNEIISSLWLGKEKLGALSPTFNKSWLIISPYLNLSSLCKFTLNQINNYD